MAEWIYEAGIGEARAALLADGQLIEAHIEPAQAGLRAGTICMARLTDVLIPGRRGIVVCERDTALLEPVPAGIAQGGQLMVEIIRDAIVEPGAMKRAKARAAGPSDILTEGPDLRARIGASGLMVREPAPHDPDILEAAGWAECLEQASSGVVPFTGGGLRVSLTPAMTVIDVDGHLPPAPLAIAAAKAVAATIRLFNLTGSIGIDFPTLANKEERLAATEAFDAILPLPYERTAMNGFGFMQVIRPRRRASLCELLQYGRCPAAARALLRTAQRSKITGSVALTAHPDVIAILRAEPGWIAILAKQLGGETILRPDARLAMNAGHVAAA